MLGAAASALGCAGTAPGATLAQLQNRAVFDLGCPGYQLGVYSVDSRTKAVTGCGRRLVYVESCQDIRGEQACTWVMNTPTYAQTLWPGLIGQQPTTVVFQQRLPAQPRSVATALFDPNAPPPAAGFGAPIPGAPRPAAPAPGAATGPMPPRGTTIGEVEGRPYSTDLFGAAKSAATPTQPDDTPEQGPDGKPRAPKRIPTDLFDDRK